MNEFRIKILQAIREGKTSEQAIAKYLNVEPDRVYSNLEILDQQDYIKGTKSFSYYGRLEYTACQLNPKGNTIIDHPEDFMEEKTMSENNPQISISNSNIASVTGEGKIDEAIANQYNYSLEQRQTLAEAADEIQMLLEQLSKTYDPPHSKANKLAIATETVKEIESNPALKSRVIGALKSGGIEALKELLDHPAVNIFMASIEGWNNPE